ncbi:MAG: DUF6807 family protein [Limisphaerales bacterium]
MSQQTPLGCQHLENISRDALEQRQQLGRQKVRHRRGVYALHRRSNLYYLGPAGAFLLAAVTRLMCVATGAELVVDDVDGAAGRAGAPVGCAVTLTKTQLTAATAGHLIVREARGGIAGAPPIPVQFEPGSGGTGIGRLWWLLPPGPVGRRSFVFLESSVAFEPLMRAHPDPGNGQFAIDEAGKPILRYNYQTVGPGDLAGAIQPDNRKYARPRSDYLHPLYGPDGEELTKDWSVDHPHHRGIYWAWPEVDYRGQRGDLHALQEVFARPTGHCVGTGGLVFAQIEAENLWRWEDQQPIVRERAVIRAYRLGAHGRCIDLELQFTALDDEVAIARRGTDKYGGLNLRMASVRDQQIVFHTDPATAKPRMAWADLSGVFAGGKETVGLAVLQPQTNPAYPGDWVKFPELNWFQPTFPAAGTRWGLKKEQPLVLRYRLWIRRGDNVPDTAYADQWRAYDATPRSFLSNRP